MSAVNVSAISIGFHLVSLVTNRVSLEEECLPSFEMVNCLLNLAAICLDDGNEIPLKVIASFSAVRCALPCVVLCRALCSAVRCALPCVVLCRALCSAVRCAQPSIPLIVLHSLVIYVFWSMFSTKSLKCCRLCSQMRFWMSLFSLGSSNEVGSLLRRSSRLVITSRISAGTGFSWRLCHPVCVWCDVALSRIVRRIFSSLWQSVGRERLLRAASTSCLYLSQLAFFRLT